jgi:hypothetical protein
MQNQSDQFSDHKESVAEVSGAVVRRQKTKLPGESEVQVRSGQDGSRCAKGQPESQQIGPGRAAKVAAETFQKLSKNFKEKHLFFLLYKIRFVIHFYPHLNFKLFCGPIFF